MADFIFATASNGPKVRDLGAVQETIKRYYVEPDVNVEIQPDPDSGAQCLCIYGYEWPRLWRVPDGTDPKDFDPYDGECDDDGSDGFAQFLKEVAPHLEGPLTVQAVGSMKCRFPLSACEWHIKPDGTEIEFTEFRHSWDEPLIASTSA